jgi:positive regulator of sigma E activity
MKYIIPIAVILWLAALAGTLVYRGNILANGALLIISLGLIVLGWWRARQSK